MLEDYPQYTGINTINDAVKYAIKNPNDEVLPLLMKGLLVSSGLGDLKDEIPTTKGNELKEHMKVWAKSHIFISSIIDDYSPAHWTFFISAYPLMFMKSGKPEFSLADYTTSKDSLLTKVFIASVALHSLCMTFDMDFGKSIPKVEDMVQREK